MRSEGGGVAGLIRASPTMQSRQTDAVSWYTETLAIAGANPARVGVMPISSNWFGPGVALLFLLGAPFLTAAFVSLAPERR